MTYKILRHFAETDEVRVIHTGMTLEQATAHCCDDQTSSRTCTEPAARLLTMMMGPWMDSYAKEH